MVMHWTLLVTCCLVVWALGGAIWRPGSLALAASWIAAQYWYALSGDSVPVGLYLLLDPIVLLTVWFYRASWLDWVVIGVFPLQWLAYFVTEGTEQWWFLLCLAGAQLLCAGPWAQIQRASKSVSHGPLRAGGT